MQPILTATLYRAMLASGSYTPMTALDAILRMRLDVLGGADPVEVLNREGFGSQYVGDLL